LEEALHQQISAEKVTAWSSIRAFACAQSVLEKEHRAASQQITPRLAARSAVVPQMVPQMLRWRKHVCIAGRSTPNDVCSAVQAGPCNVITNIEVSPFWGVQAGLGIALQIPSVLRMASRVQRGSSRSGPALIAALRRTTPKPRALRAARKAAGSRGQLGTFVLWDGRNGVSSVLAPTRLCAHVSQRTR